MDCKRQKEGIEMSVLGVLLVFGILGYDLFTVIRDNKNV